jgi:hypothetical protein
VLTAKPAPSKIGPKLKMAQYSKKLETPRRGWRTRQMVLNAFSMVTNIQKAVTANTTTPIQVSWRA